MGTTDQYTVTPGAPQAVAAHFQVARVQRGVRDLGLTGGPPWSALVTESCLIYTPRHPGCSLRWRCRNVSDFGWLVLEQGGPVELFGMK